MDDLKLYGSSQQNIDSLIQNVYIVTNHIGMILGIQKCAVLAMGRGKESESDGITIGSEEVTSEIDDGGYKYFGIMERSDIYREKMARSIKTKYLKLVRSAVKSALSKRNVFQYFNIWAVPTVRHGAGIIKWTKIEP